jgi:hypothetical protein
MESPEHYETLTLAELRPLGRTAGAPHRDDIPGLLRALTYSNLAVAAARQGEQTDLGDDPRGPQVGG